MGQKTISIDDARPGMVLADDVADARGNVLVKRGVQLNESWIKGIRSRGIDQLTVEDASAPAAGESDGSASEKPGKAARADVLVGSPVEMRVADKFRRIETMFSDCREHPVMGALAEAAKEHARSKLVEE